MPKSTGAYGIAHDEPLAIASKNSESLLITIDEACQTLRVSRSTLYALIRERRIEIRQINKSSRVTVESLRRFVESLPNCAGDFPIKQAMKKAEATELLEGLDFQPRPEAA